MTAPERQTHQLPYGLTAVYVLRDTRPGRRSAPEPAAAVEPPQTLELFDTASTDPAVIAAALATLSPEQRAAIGLDPTGGAA